MRACALGLNIYFNSIKVRLEPPYLQGGNMNKKFQFHKGAIRTGRGIYIQCHRTSFQFHKGTIKTVLPLFWVVVVYYFNSIKVRLKHKPKYQHRTKIVFQFHKGTIKTVVTLTLICLQLNFNSIKVRLKLEGHNDKYQ